ncbi:alpha/beta fold hydrolase [Flavobacterium sp. Sd200]|uniref:alpha/beta hydrolase n=1 Tax=Flavobacterium sp. Sd200 TaxID=2692211 RepID=UPI001368BB26|nr:alpha/beta hydrolase [Flavobacterium sp. Sd200]MXN91566.1 alpha/beta fold hydrolase [Flavobacterium sp. Sd200]
MQKLFKTIIAKLLGFYINLLSCLTPKKAQKLAYRFFSEPQSGRLFKDSLPSVLQEAETETVTYKDMLFQTYVWKGNACKVLLIHGWESNAARWKLFITYLKKAGCTIIAIDGPAHGLSSGTEFTIPRYAEFMDIIVQQYQPQYLVGHSLGGSTILYYQSHYNSNSIQKMVVMGAPCDFTMILSNYIKTLSLSKKSAQLLNNHFIEELGINTEEFSCGLFASKITAQGLVVHDVDDTTVPFKEGRKIAESWPNAQFLRTKGQGHSMHSDAMYSKIYSFLFDVQ